MAMLGSTRRQARTGRRLTYWCAYEIVQDTSLCYVAAINEGLALLGQHEGTLRFDPHGMPADAIGRMNLGNHIDRTSFGEGKLPEARWLGWYRPYR